MKKYTAVLLLISILTLSTIACNRPQIIDDDNSNDNNKTSNNIQEYVYYVPTKMIVSDKDYLRTYEFCYSDENYLLKLKDYLNDSSDVTEILFDLDSNNNPTKRTVYHGDAVLGETTFYTYDDNRLLVQMDKTYPNRDGYTNNYVYDNNGRLIKKINQNGMFTDYIYNSKGNLLKEVAINSSDEEFICEYTYDYNGNLIKKIGSYSDGIYENYEYSYYSDGKIKNEINRKINHRYTFFYDSEGFLTKKALDYSSGSSIWEYFYDENKNLIKVTELYNDGFKITEKEITTIEYIQIELPGGVPKWMREELEKSFSDRYTIGIYI